LLPIITSMRGYRDQVWWLWCLSFQLCHHGKP
jgi:hypothetical protein